MHCAVNLTVYDKYKEWVSLHHAAIPFPHIVIDNFLDESLAEDLLRDFPGISAMSRSHHYIYSPNKYVLSKWNQISNSFTALYKEVTSSRLKLFLSKLAGENVFIDCEFGGDIHQGVNGSFLEMHTDFNLHPSKHNWLHCLNILIYLNKDWKKEYGGQLLLRSGLTGLTSEIAPQFNRCIIMQSDETTYHGFEQLRLPEGLTRKVILIPIYKEELFDRLPVRKLASFAPEKDSLLKFRFAKLYNSITSLKARLKAKLF
ncbi:2OG-Fe(II) oxygenase [Nostoc sp. NMS8]|uniref:2OG-Fe(II) oxygenase n=1 Tax=Nostoc sp. NMS8 TaxID=2815392 RepID=UPI0025FB5174|nr:2OG-Fe(II) oxygenase [Nostoc sp. NMS8]MBN3962490.1 2OG-Fe(II) oxygenase [Nostoc sp. NMS8]